MLPTPLATRARHPLAACAAACWMLAALLATGCAAPPPAADAATADAGQVCTREAVIGSNRVVTRCVSRADAEAERDAARQSVGDMRSTKGGRPTAPGL
jgi:hypothetical protein